MGKLDQTSVFFVISILLASILAAIVLLHIDLSTSYGSMLATVAGGLAAKLSTIVDYVFGNSRKEEDGSMEPRNAGSENRPENGPS